MYHYGRNEKKTAAADESLDYRFQRVMVEWLKEFGEEFERKGKDADLAFRMRYAEVAVLKNIRVRDSGGRVQISFDGDLQRFRDPNSNQARFIGYVAAEVRPTHVNTVPYKLHVEVVGGSATDSSGSMSDGPGNEAWWMVGKIAQEVQKALPDFWQHLRP